MDIHKPKPVHGWRELLSEIGIIVIGVLIALGAEQVVEVFHWRHQVSEQKIALKDELGETAVFFYERLAVGDCLRARIHALDAALAAQGNDWNAVKFLAANSVASVHRAPWRGYSSQAWQNALTSGTASHFPSDELLSYETIYSGVSDVHQMNIQEEIAAGQLSDLDHDMTFTDVSRDRYRRALDELKFYSGGAFNIAQESLRQLKGMLLLPPARDLQDALQNDRNEFGKCVKTPEI